MNKAKLILLTYPLLLASMLGVNHPVQAREIVFEATNQQNVSALNQPSSESMIKEQTSQDATLELSEEELNIAIERYGCDCTGCLNNIRQLQGKLPLL